MVVVLLRIAKHDHNGVAQGEKITATTRGEAAVHVKQFAESERASELAVVYPHCSKVRMMCNAAVHHLLEVRGDICSTLTIGAVKIGDLNRVRRCVRKLARGI